MSKKRYAVVGLGTPSSFGYNIAKMLGNRGFEVIAVDKDESAINEIKEYVSEAIIANAADKNVLESLGIGEIDVALVSLGERIDASILVTLYLKELGVREIIVKAVSDAHKKILELTGATDVIFVEKDMATRLVERISNPNILEYIELFAGYSIIEVAPPKSYLGKTLKDLDIRRKYKVQVIACRDVLTDEVSIIPDGDYVVKDSDELVLLGKVEDLVHMKKNI